MRLSKSDKNIFVLFLINLYNRFRVNARQFHVFILDVICRNFNRIFTAVKVNTVHTPIWYVQSLVTLQFMLSAIFCEHRGIMTFYT